MADARRYLAQGFLYLLFFLPLAWLTHNPPYRHMDDGMAVLKVAVRHAGAVVGDCEPLGNTDGPALPGNPQRPQVCPRERSPLRLELRLDGATVYRDSIPAPGLHNDGIASVYRRFSIPAGTYRLELLMNDDVAQRDFNWQFADVVELAPAQVLVATFQDGFTLQ